jgi:hypothetical protein
VRTDSSMGRIDESESDSEDAIVRTYAAAHHSLTSPALPGSSG